MREIDVGLDGVKAVIVYHTFDNYTLKTFLVSFEDKRKALSTQDGLKYVKFVGNNYAPQNLWKYVYKRFADYKLRITQDLGAKPEEMAMLYTGADMDKIHIACDGYKDIKFCACVTAGVKTNAQRVGVDKASSIEVNEGEFESIGTVNIILLTNAELSDGSMAGSLITITEAKTIAFQDLDIKSSFNPELQATGTGTDGIIVASGLGPKLTYVGGHAKAGEIIARLVTASVKEAIVSSN